MSLELVSFKTCPYVQRSVITLKQKGVDFDITYIDLDDPPQWFKDASPLGKVPILRTEDGVLFESAVINEYVDETTPGSLMPDDAWQRAQTRAWIAFGGECLADYYQASVAADEATFTGHRDALVDKLGRLEGQLIGPFFLGDDFTLADAALAPLLMRMEHFATVAPGFDLSRFPGLQAWARRLAELPAVQDSIVPEWRDLLSDYIVRNGPFLGQQIAV